MLFKRQGTTFTSSSVLGYHDSGYIFDHSEGLNFAIGLIDSLNFAQVDPLLGRPLEDFAELNIFKITTKSRVDGPTVE